MGEQKPIKRFRISVGRDTITIGRLDGRHGERLSSLHRSAAGKRMVIWVSSPDKRILGYLSVEDFCAMTEYPLPPDGQGIKDGVELCRTDEYIFGALRTSKHRPTLRWSQEHQNIQPLKPRPT